MPYFALAERRTGPRYPTDGLLVSVRKKGRLAHLQGIAQDFNRHGMALQVDQPIAKDTKIFVTLASGEILVQNVAGIVHNCVAVATGYRCGIQFRTAWCRQADQTETIAHLCNLETRFAEFGCAEPNKETQDAR